MEWFVQKTAPGMELRIANVRTLAHERSAFQEILIFENPTLGLVLVLDGILQLSEFDERIYHESLVLPASEMCSANDKVLILGGGDGGAAAVCVSGQFSDIRLVEIDRRVLELSQLYFPDIWKRASSDKLSIYVEDARNYIYQADDEFDLIICDFTDYARNTKTENLYGFSFYNNLKGILNKGGVMVTQAGASWVYPRVRAKIAERLRKVFRHVGFIDFPSLTFGTATGSACIAWDDDGALDRSLTRNVLSFDTMVQLDRLRRQTSHGSIREFAC